MQDKLVQKDDDYHMVSNETFLNHLYCLETEDRQERAKKQKLKESFEKKGNFMAAEAVEIAGHIPKKDEKHKCIASKKDSSKKTRKP
jgi:hypothetical protein